MELSFFLPSSPSQLFGFFLFGSWASDGPMRAILWSRPGPVPTCSCSRMDLELSSPRTFTCVFIWGKLLLPPLWALSLMGSQWGFLVGLLVSYCWEYVVTNVVAWNNTICYLSFPRSGIWFWPHWVLCSESHQDEIQVLAETAASSEAGGPLQSSGAVGRSQLLAIIGLKSWFLAGGPSAPRGYSQVWLIMWWHQRRHGNLSVLWRLLLM